MLETIRETAKSIAALVALIATGLLTVYTPDTAVGHWVTVAAVVAGAIAVWAVPNEEAYEVPFEG